MALISSGIGCSWGQGRFLFGDLHLLHTEICRDNPSFVQRSENVFQEDKYS
jgi:hypothetical protein